MVAYERFITVTNPNEITLTGLPLQPGQRVRITVVVEDANRTAAVAELRDLLKSTQTLPQAQRLSEEDIAAEIAAHRRSNAA